MKRLQLLKQNIDKLGQKYLKGHHLYGQKDKTLAKKSPVQPLHKYDWFSKLHKSKPIRTLHPPIMLGLSVISLTIVIGYRFYNQPQLSVGTVSPVKVVAPRDEEFVDEKTTEEKRKEVRTGIIPILQRDIELTSQLKADLNKTLTEINQFRQQVGIFPFVSGSLIPTGTQQHLRRVDDNTWATIRTIVFSNKSQPFPNLQLQTVTAIDWLKRYEQKTSTNALKGLLDTIGKSRKRYHAAKREILNAKTSNLTPEVLGIFLDLDDSNWQTTQKTINITLNRILSQGVPSGTPDYLLQEIINNQLESAPSSVPKTAITDVLMKVLHNKHNLMVDKEATRQRAEKAALAMKPVIVEIRAGDVIVEAGEEITQGAFVLLDGFQLSRRGVNWVGLGFSAGIVVGTVIIFSMVTHKLHRPIRRRDHILLCLLSLSTPVLGIFNLGYTNLPAVGLLASSFYGPTLAITQVILLSGLSTFAAPTINWSYVLAGTIGGLIAASAAGKLRSRDELACLGGVVGLVQGSLYFVGYLIAAPVAGTIWSIILPEAIIYGLSGIAWSVMALGISPYLERLFDLVTPIRLVELANPNCALLKRLATETPGTFQHTLFVACLAEAAARELHCNVELIRAGTLYHDIGKMHDPMGFIENQMGNPNKHDLINNPRDSVNIIKKHVSEGLVMANKYGLPRVIRDFIPEHQGTLLISYFYYQAKQEAERNGTEMIAEEEFRYAGPIPQSRETGIVMLADGCEAALRSLKEATPETALAMIQKIFKARWRDHQLKDSGIKYEELPIIAEVFVKVWQQFHHQRIVYPKAALEPQNNKQG